MLIPWVSELVVDEDLQGGVVQVGGEGQPGQGYQEEGGEDLHHWHWNIFSFSNFSYFQKIFYCLVHNTSVSWIFFLNLLLSVAKIFSCFEKYFPPSTIFQPVLAWSLSARDWEREKECHHHHLSVFSPSPTPVWCNDRMERWGFRKCDQAYMYHTVHSACYLNIHSNQYMD